MGETPRKHRPAEQPVESAGAERGRRPGRERLQDRFVDGIDLCIFKETLRVGVTRFKQTLAHKIAALRQCTGNHTGAAAASAEDQAVVHGSMHFHLTRASETGGAHLALPCAPLLVADDGRAGAASVRR